MATPPHPASPTHHLETAPDARAWSTADRFLSVRRSRAESIDLAEAVEVKEPRGPEPFARPVARVVRTRGVEHTPQVGPRRVDRAPVEAVSSEAKDDHLGVLLPKPGAESKARKTHCRNS